MTHLADGTILIVGDDRSLVRDLAIRCSQMGLQVQRTHDARAALKLIKSTPANVACVDVASTGANGFTLVESIVSNQCTAYMPIIVLVSETDEDTNARCEHLGVHRVLKGAGLVNRLSPLLQRLASAGSGSSAVKSLRSAALAASRDDESPRTSRSYAHRLVDAVSTAFGVDHRHETARSRDNATRTADIPWVLTIDDDPDFTFGLKKRLESHGVAVARACDGTDGVHAAFSRPANVILLDYAMPNGQGDYVLDRLKDNAVTRDIPVIVLTGKHDRALERKMMNLGAARFMTKPFEFDELLAELRKHIDVLPTAATSKFASTSGAAS